MIKINEIDSKTKLESKFKDLMAESFGPEMSLVQYRRYNTLGFGGFSAYAGRNLDITNQWVYELARVLDKKKMGRIKRFLSRHDKTERLEIVKIYPLKKDKRPVLPNGPPSFFEGNRFNSLDIKVYSPDALPKAKVFAERFEQLSGEKAVISIVN